MPFMSPAHDNKDKRRAFRQAMDGPTTSAKSTVLSVAALRPGVVKDDSVDMDDSAISPLGDTFPSGVTGLTRVATPVSYLRMSSAAATASESDRRGRASPVLRGRSRNASPLAASAGFPPLQPRTYNQQHRPASSSLSTASSSSPDRASLEPDWQRAPHILIVDNIALLQETAKRLLEGYGCVVEVANDGAQAMDACNWSRTKFDLVIMRLNGASATYLIRDYDKRIPIIALLAGTSKSEDALHNHYHRVGMNDVLPASPSSAKLLSTVDKHLSHLRRPSGPLKIITQTTGPFGCVTDNAMEHTSPFPLTRFAERAALNVSR